MRNSIKNDDAALVEACIQKDAEAWTALISKYSSLVNTSISNRLRKYGFNPSCEETEDIRQNLFVSIWTSGKLEKVRNRRSIAYWLAIVAGNAAIAHMRQKMGAETIKFVPLLETEEAEALITTPAIDDLGPSLLDHKNLVETIERSIEKLPPKEQLVTKLNLLHNMGYREIAEMLKIPAGTVSSYIKRAKDKLKEELKKM
jgi:RNA polymerase sigma-70 factor (ECF subfamily)